MIFYEGTFPNFSVKLCIQTLKEENNSLIQDSGKKVHNLTSYINNLIMNGIHGAIKKENIITTLQELMVSNNYSCNGNTFSILCSIKIIILLRFLLDITSRCAIDHIRYT